MARLTKKQTKVLLSLDDATTTPGPVDMDVVQELVGLGLIGKSGDEHLEFTEKGEKAIKQLQEKLRAAQAATPSS